MTAVYIISNHGKLSAENGTLKLFQEDGTERTMFPHSLDSLVISGKVSITARAMDLLMIHSINTIFINSKNGKYNGKLEFLPSKNIFLRKKQYALTDDLEMSLKIAKQIVISKVKNQLSFAQRIKRKNTVSDETEPQFISHINYIKEILNECERVKSINELRGYEGIAAREYFAVMRHNILPSWANFRDRTMNPPKSNVNAVLSFLYTLLMYRVETAINVAGLDPMAGFLHSHEYGKNSLVFDLMEEFRTPIADSLCCSLFNLNQLAEEDFREVKADEDYNEDAILLTKDGLSKTICEFEKKIDSIVMHSANNEKLSLNKIIIEQVKHFKRVIAGDEVEYKGFYFK